MRNELSRRRRVGKMVLFGCVLSVGLAASAGAVEVGERIGPLELTTLDGPCFVMDNYDKRVGTVIAFLSSRCPVTDRMAERINYIQEEYRHDDILWVGIGANPAESGDELRDFCQKQGMIFPFYQDPQGKIRKRFGPKVTPEVFLLNANSEVVYHGAIGDSEDVALEAAAMGRCSSNGRALPVRVIGRCIPVIPFKTNWREAKGIPLHTIHTRQYEKTTGAYAVYISIGPGLLQIHWLYYTRSCSNADYGGHNCFLSQSFASSAKSLRLTAPLPRGSL